MPKKALDDHQMDMIYQLCKKDGMPQSKVAALYDVSQGTVSNALRQKRHEAEIARLQDTLERGFTHGVKAAAKEGAIQFTPPAGYIDMDE